MGISLIFHLITGKLHEVYELAVFLNVRHFYNARRYKKVNLKVIKSLLKPCGLHTNSQRTVTQVFLTNNVGLLILKRRHRLKVFVSEV